jgi:PIN domain nuclease of toxin-antitoxin system
MITLELQYLYEIGKERDTPDKVMSGVRSLTELHQSTSRFDEVIERAMSLTWTRDPFDRLIVAEAMCNDASLVTADENIRKHYMQAVW